MDFPVSSADCRLLMLLEAKGSLSDVAKELGRDISVISRQVSRLAETIPLVEKIDGKWQVSALGKKFTNWARDSILTQNCLLRSQSLIRIATTPEFAARVLAPKLAEIRGDNENLLIEILSAPDGIEDLLLKGEADLGLDCGIPHNPALKFHRIVPESFCIVVSPQFQKKWGIQTLSRLLEAPHLQLQSRISANHLLKLQTDLVKPCAFFHDIATLRAACVSGFGWALLPHYSVRRELELNELMELHGSTFPLLEPEIFGVWWLRNRKGMSTWAKTLATWLKQQILT